jgi:hypothetical protein
MTSTPSMPARPFPSTGVRSSNHPAGAGAPTSLSACNKRFFARRVSSRRAFLFAPAPAGIRRDQSSFLTTQAVWAPGASALGICS